MGPTAFEFSFARSIVCGGPTIQCYTKELGQLLVTIVAMGVYLSCTAMLEAGHVWSFVFPRYIADPNLGIHFGRARAGT